MSRVADELGTGSSFNRARGVSARRAAVAATTGVPTAGAPDSRLRTLPLEQLVPTRFNPRRNFGTEDDLREFGLKLKKKQLQPAVAVTRDAYLELWSEEADSLGSAKYVIANGERRYRGSLAAGLTTLEVVVDDDIAKSRADFLDAVLSENNDREDLDPIERALGIKTMVEQLGGKAKVAEHYQKSGGWVTQQMYLLDLAPELQQLVSSGELPARETRALVKLPPEEQMTAWQERLAERQEEKAQPRPTRRQQAPAPETELEDSERRGGQGFTAVKNAPPATPQPALDATPAPQTFTAVKPTQTPPAPVPAEQHIPTPSADPPQAREAPATGMPETIPEPRPEVIPEGRKLPYDDGVTVAQHLTLKMGVPPFVKMVQVTTAECWDKAGPAETLSILDAMMQTASERDADALRALLEKYSRECSVESAPS